MTNLEIIRQACIKANPEIMELKRGCEIKLNTTYYGVTIGEIVSRAESCVWVIVKGNRQPLFLEEEAILKILGREIRLCDVLLALREVKTGIIGVDCFGQFIRLGEFQSNMKSGIYWDLKHDNLELQSEETIKFLAELLTPIKQ